MKHLFTTAALLFSITAFAQVGINTTTPKATLDIKAKTTDGSKPEGLLIPQLDGNSLKTAAYGTAQKGVIVYAKSAASPTDTKTVNVTIEGYYYFDGSAWQKMNGAASGDTTNDAWANDTTNGLVKLGTKADGTARAAGTDFVVKDNGEIGIGTSTPTTKLEINSSTSGAIKIVDGTQAIGRVLTSDANGLATWTPVGQSASYHDVSSSRSLETLYTNSTGKEMKIFMTAFKSGGSLYCHLTPVIGGFSMLYQNLDDGRQMQLFYIIPPGATYKFASQTGANFSPAAVSSWYEYY
ncbi:hypothetical protein [Chryseobacterium lineare]